MPSGAATRSSSPDGVEQAASPPYENEAVRVAVPDASTEAWSLMVDNRPWSSQLNRSPGESWLDPETTCWSVAASHTSSSVADRSKVITVEPDVQLKVDSSAESVRAPYWSAGRPTPTGGA